MLTFVNVKTYGNVTVCCKRGPSHPTTAEGITRKEEEMKENEIINAVANLNARARRHTCK
jgi:hypothetical protein